MYRSINLSFPMVQIFQKDLLAFQAGISAEKSSGYRIIHFPDFGQDCPVRIEVPDHSYDFLKAQGE